MYTYIYIHMWQYINIYIYTCICMLSLAIHFYISPGDVHANEGASVFREPRMLDEEPHLPMTPLITPLRPLLCSDRSDRYCSDQSRANMANIRVSPADDPTAHTAVEFTNSR